MKFAIGAQSAKVLLVSALATGVLSSAAGQGTIAYFTTQVTSGSNTFTAGNLHFTISDGNQAANQNSVSTTLTLSDMKPGDVVFAPVTLANTGSLNAKWGIRYTTTTSAANLATALQLGIVAKGDGTAVVADCTAADFTTAAKWAEQIRPTPLAMVDAGAIIVNYQSTVAPTVDGEWDGDDTTAGAYLPLNHVGAATNKTDIVCVQIKFPDGDLPTSETTEDNAWNGATSNTYNTTVVFTFDGMQRELSHEYVQ